ncbi:protein ImuA [Arcticibacter pallidicorallinus]|uniref:Protein ImuA n=2 Tax=Arcticibacter pallidicorallinus TaxID=1259464 RepID=A0A2T0U5W7_9SPHI|nr:protein ImuA [Arcticibacter pallidicorallinus]
MQYKTMEGKKELIEKLQKDILLWQGYKPQESCTAERIGLGIMETAFPNGVFPTRGIHEFITAIPEHSAASDGFISALLAILMKNGAGCVWISTSRKLFPASLRTFNVDPERIIFMDVSKEQDVLWIMEEALKCDGFCAVVAEITSLNLTESRRLQLAVEKNGVTGFILRKDLRKAVSNIATARWRISPLPSYNEDEMPGIGFPRWNIELLKVRNGNPGSWELEWAGDRFVVIDQEIKKDSSYYAEQRQIG